MPKDNESGERRRSNDRDHDLLIEIKNQLGNLVKTTIEKNYEYEKKYDDHEERIRFIEKSMWIGFGAIAILQVVLKFLL